MKPRILPQADSIPPIRSDLGITQCVWKRFFQGDRVLLSAFFVLLPVLWASMATVRAEDRQPPPHYASVQAAQAVVDAAKDEADRIKQKHEAEVQACMTTFFATRCSEQSRIERNNALNEVDSRRRQAELFIRQEHSRERHEKLEQDNARRDARAAERAAKTVDKPPRPSASPEVPATEPLLDAPAAGGSIEPPRQGSTPPARSDDAQLRAQKRAAFERKQQDAKEYAEKQARQREEAVNKRARRRAEREAEAQRLNQGSHSPSTPSLAK